MKKTLILRIGLAILSTSVALNAKAHLEVSGSIQINAVADFESPLASVGVWIDIPGHGHCWRPRDVETGWRPYSNGHWVWTDLGWYWESDEPWAWACYHYGDWAYEDAYGWVWVPEVQWAPAWVVWRTGGDYIGWAPMAPAGWVSARIPAPTHFVFIETRHFTEPIRPTTVVVNSTTIINKTTVINNVRQENRTVEGSTRQVIVNTGPGIEPIQRATGRAVAPTPLREVVARIDTKAPPEVRPERRNQREQTGAPQPQPSTIQPAQSGQTQQNPVTQQRTTTQPQQPTQSERNSRERTPTQTTPAPSQPATPTQPRRDEQPRERTQPSTQPITPTTPNQPTPPTQRREVEPMRPVTPTPPQPTPPAERERRQPRERPQTQREIPITPAPAQPQPPERNLTPQTPPTELPAQRPGRGREIAPPVTPPERPAVPPGQERRDERDKKKDNP